jgi:hypothetical protein
MLRYATISLLCIQVFCSCTALKKTQIQAAENFAVATKGISRVPSDIYFRIYQLKSESQTLLLNTMLATNNDTKESIQLLKEDFQEKMQFLEIAEAYSAAYLIVEQYASLVLCLLDQSYQREFNKSKDTWQASFNGLVSRYNKVAIHKIPSSVNNVAAAIVKEIGELKIAQLQKKYLKEAIHVARVPFENICEDFIRLDSLKIKNELKNLPEYLDNNYANFLENVRAYENTGNNPYLFFRDYTPVYTSWLFQVNELAILSDKTLQAFRSLKNAYGDLEAYIHQSSPGTIPASIRHLMNDYSQLADSYRKFQVQQQKLNASTFLN